MSRNGNRGAVSQEMLSLLPSINAVSGRLSLDEAYALGANETGDDGRTGPIYKLLCQEGIMVTFELRGKTLVRTESEHVHL